MGNRSGSSRSKTREAKYKYPDNYPNNGAAQKHNGGSVNAQVYSSQMNGYPRHPGQQYQNGYGTHSMNNTPNQYIPTQTQAHHHATNTNTNPKSNPSSIL
jgi:hypothetical protein